MEGLTSIANLWMWFGFIAFIVAMLALDLFVLGGREVHRLSFREAAGWSVLWFLLAIIFNVLLWWYLDHRFGAEIATDKALEFFTGYLIEKSLSVDNIFVFLMIFSYFGVPAEYQRRVLLYGVLGAILMRAVMILLGAWPNSIGYSISSGCFCSSPVCGCWYLPISLPIWRKTPCCAGSRGISASPTPTMANGLP